MQSQTGRTAVVSMWKWYNVEHWLCAGDYFSRWIVQIRIQHHSLLMTIAHRAEVPLGEEVLTLSPHKASVPPSMATLLMLPVQVLMHLRRDTG